MAPDPQLEGLAFEGLSKLVSFLQDEG